MIFNPYSLLGGCITALALFTGGFATGKDWAETRAEAERVHLVEQQAQRMRQEVARGDTLAAKLASAEGQIVIKTVEVIKHVPTVTTGRKCLDPAAVGLLQPGAAAAPDDAPGKPDAENADAPAASDRDVAFWIADANQQYDTCAARLNALIDWSAP